MATGNRIFAGVLCVTSVLALVCLVPCVGYAALDASGCSDNDNEWITPELALCSVHAYNIGATSNPDEATAQIMRDVVALKTTVISQQMYNQYETLKNTISRMKIMLEKEVYKAKLQAKTGVTSDTDSSENTYKSTNKYIHIAGVNDCSNQDSYAKIFSCLQNNYNQIYSSANQGKKTTADLRKQLAADYSIMCDNTPSGVTLTQCTDDNGECKNAQSLTNQSKFENCMQKLKSGILSVNDKIEKDNRPVNTWGGRM